MIPYLPDDSALPRLDEIFDGERMRTLIATHLLAGSDITIQTCTPTYVRYKPGTSCLVAYDLLLRNASGEERTAQASIKLFNDDRARRRAESKKLRRLAERVLRGCAEPENMTAWIPGLNGLLQVYPVDYDLPALARFSDAKSATRALRKAGAPDAARVTAEPERIRYKPDRKAMLRYAVKRLPTERIYAKLLEDDRTGRLARQTAVLIDAGIPTPPVIAVNPNLGLIAHTEAPGVQLASLRGTGTFTGLMPAIAELLQAFSRVDLADAPRHTLADEADRIRETAKLLGVIAPALAPRLTHLAHALLSRLGNLPDVLVTSHGDFYDDQLLIDDDRITVIDLDELRLAHPLLDPGNMLAHLRSGTNTDAAHNAYLAATREQTGASGHEIALFEAIALLKLAPGPFRRLEDDWTAKIERILALAELTLAESPQPQAAKPDTLVTDPALPQLVTLLDIDIMAEKIANRTNGPVVEHRATDHHNADGDRFSPLADVHLIRHKPGRRAILRYTLQSGERLFGKTFASKRGPKVYRITSHIVDAQAFGPDVALPEPVAWLPDEKLILQRAVPGAPVERLLCHGDTWLAREIATALHRFHTSGLELGRSHDLAKELGPLPQRTAEVSAVAPELRPLAQSCLDRSLAVRQEPFHWRSRSIHRDFYHDQVLVHDGRLAVLDLDDASMSEPTIDVANFAAHLILLGAQQPGYAHTLRRVREAFLDRYRELDPGLDDALLRFLTATTLLRLSGIHAPRKDGERVARELLETAHAILDTLEHARHFPVRKAS